MITTEKLTLLGFYTIDDIEWILDLNFNEDELIFNYNSDEVILSLNGFENIKLKIASDYHLEQVLPTVLTFYLLVDGKAAN